MIDAGQPAKDHGTQRFVACAMGGTRGALGIPASDFVSENDKTTISAAAAVIIRRIVRPIIRLVARLQSLSVRRERSADYRQCVTINANFMGYGVFATPTGAATLESVTASQSSGMAGMSACGPKLTRWSASAAGRFRGKAAISQPP